MNIRLRIPRSSMAVTSEYRFEKQYVTTLKIRRLIGWMVTLVHCKKKHRFFLQIFWKFCFCFNRSFYGFSVIQVFTVLFVN